MGKPKIVELDIARAVAILAVILIHGTSDAVARIPQGSRSQVLYFAMNVMSGFAVQLFIILSGIVLFYRYSEGWSLREALNFYRKRLQFVVIPYLIWSLFYNTYNRWADSGYQRSGLKLKWHDYADKLQWADNGYHLYFIIIIVQFYLLFPVLMTLVRKLPVLGRYLIPFGILVNLVFYVVNRWYHHFEHKPSLCWNYFAIFCIGAYIGLHYDKVRRGETHLWWVFGLTVAMGYTYYLLYLLQNHHITFNLTFFDLLMNAYPVGVCLSLLWIGRKLAAASPRALRLLQSLGAASFGIYLMHPAVLTLIRLKTVYPPAALLFHAAAWFGILGALLVPWAFVLLVKRWRMSWILLGR